MESPNPADALRTALSQIEHDLRNAATIMVGVGEEIQDLAAELPDTGPLADLLAQALSKVLAAANGIQSVRRGSSPTRK